MIVGQNALLNQYVPTFYIKNIKDGQGLIYDAVRKAYVNSDFGGSGGAERLGELLDVDPSVDNPLALQNGQALTYNTNSNLWENKFIDYNTLLNKPTSSSFSFAGLSDTAKPSLPDGYVKWNSAGTQLVYSTTIPAASITGLATVATTGDYNSLINKPTITGGTVTSVAITSANGVSGTVANPTTTPAITIVLGAITPTSVLSSGTITGTNLSGTNTGDQTITLTGDVTGSGTGSFSTSLATVNLAPQTDTFRKITVNSKGLVTATSAVTSADITSALGFTPYDVTNPAGYTSNLGTVTSVGATGSSDITITGSTITTSGTFAFGLSDTTVLANTYGSSTTIPQFTVDAKGRITNVVNVPISGSGIGTVTSIDVSGGTTGLTATGGPITSAGTITLGGTLGIANGGTGATTATDAINALLPNQSSSIGMFLTTDGTTISWASIPAGTGTVTSVSAYGSNGILISGSPITTSGTINIDLGDITPTSVAATGTVTGSNLSGTNTGDQTITLTGDVTGSGTGSFTTTLATVNITPGVYGTDHLVPTITVNEKGLVTSITTQHVDNSIRDLVDLTETLVIAARHQYIVTGTLEVLGRIENNGRIAIL